MNGMSIFEDGHPHGTRTGYELGCKGHYCPVGVEGAPSCVEAHIRYQGDWGYRKAVDVGLNLTQLVARDVAIAAAEKAARQAARATERIPSRKRRKHSPLFIPGDVHGTIAGFYRGCREIEDCPNHTTDEITCREARRQYAREWLRKDVAKKKAQQQVTAA